MKFSIMDFFSKRGQIRTFLWIWLHLLKESLMQYHFLCSFGEDKISLNKLAQYFSIFSILRFVTELSIEQKNS